MSVKDNSLRLTVYRKKRSVLVLLLLVGVVFLSFAAFGRYHMGVSLKSSALDDCQRQASISAREQCWTKLLDNTVTKQGIGPALDVVAEIYKKNPYFFSACHTMSHEVGYRAFEKFDRGEPFKISPNANFCSYGFYHGFMLAFMKKYKDFAKTRAFCETIDKQLSSTTTYNLEFECYHGIGHGTVNVDDDPSLTGNAPEMARRSIDICEKVAEVENQRIACGTGIFNGLVDFFVNGQYGLKINKEDPYWVCALQKNPYDRLCYSNMGWLVVVATGGMNFPDAFSYTLKLYKGIPDAISGGLGALVRYQVEIRERDKSFVDFAPQCREIGEDFRLECFADFGKALFKFGRPGAEYEDGLTACLSDKFYVDEKKACLDAIKANIVRVYSQKKVEELCPKNSACGAI